MVIGGSSGSHRCRYTNCCTTSQQRCAWLFLTFWVRQFSKHNTTDCLFYILNDTLTHSYASHLIKTADDIELISIFLSLFLSFSLLFPFFFLFLSFSLSLFFSFSLSFFLSFSLSFFLTFFLSLKLL